jgi:hypothetical protein
MFGIPIEGLTNNNEAVIKNAIHPESTFEEETQCDCLSLNERSIAARTIRVTKEDGNTNLADVLTQPLSQVAKEFLCHKFMYSAAEPRFISADGSTGYLLGTQQMCGLTYQVAGREAKVAIPPGHAVTCSSLHQVVMSDV